MFLGICALGGRNAVCDGYKNIVNNLTKKEEWIVVNSCFYKNEEFKGNFAKLIKESFTYTSGSYISRIKNAINFAIKIKTLSEKYKIKQCFIYFDNAWFNLFLIYFMRKSNMKYYIWIHDPELHLGENKGLYFIRYLISLYVYPKVTKFFVTYSNGATILSEKYKIVREKIDVVKLPEMIELEYEGLKLQEKTIMKFDYDLIFYGRLEMYKGIDVMIDAVDKLNKTNKKVKLLIVGTGKLEQIIKERLANSQGITFINEYVDNQKLAEYIIQSKCVVLPYREATGTQTIQIANYYNKPVLVTKVGCFTEYVEEYVNGIFIENLSIESVCAAVLKLLDDDVYLDLRNKIEAYFVQNFKMSSVIQEIEAKLSE